VIDTPALLILGMCDSVKTTVVGGLVTRTDGGFDHPQPQDISANRALIGMHLEHAHEPAFATVSITLKNSGPFFDRDAFDRTSGLDKEQLSVSYNPTDDISFFVRVESFGFTPTSPPSNLINAVAQA
jgi:ApeA N-terminal domain 1